ncbi:DUF2878 domain-containing protein [Legionella worsleiensis]|uniref:DUF2878 domain-containing protein n=1 Tax=Legionella worsleiensis TaxID=45076 RepID=A0A0W1AKT9_9GAMM|nr:DUF2878 domain-containing protein [Legionella worsleiensis]KTD81943.1 hypothetical protein Lwor_0246 [Legionella worsleiensis]STY31300.1 Protein of uncharacterised function (DUF2878) [Legionella worsleiensis]
MNKLFIIITYYIVWFGSLILAAHQHPWMALLLSLIISGIQLYFWCDLPKVKHPQYFIFSLSFVGFLCDSLFNLTSLISFQANPFAPYFAPPWMLGLWVNFSVLCIGLADMLSQLRSYLWFFALIGFPVAYLGGAGFHVAQFPQGFISLVILGCTWMVLFPMVCLNVLFTSINPTIKDKNDNCS